MLDINKQPMKYALQGQTVEVEETDEYGNVIYESYEDMYGNIQYYLDSQGNKIPKTKEVSGFSMPVPFKANISNKLSCRLFSLRVCYKLDTNHGSKTSYITNNRMNILIQPCYLKQ